MNSHGLYHSYRALDINGLRQRILESASEFDLVKNRLLLSQWRSLEYRPAALADDYCLSLVTESYAQVVITTLRTVLWCLLGIAAWADESETTFAI
ncbi:hypothetical protein GCM10009000_085480 [Halobacterium noricense]|uniref:Uncharacterized protein n=2 Tax=Haladaptatus pallidirubidus TaxID=1008152 RepID=A0AAV3URZ1_9EURY